MGTVKKERALEGSTKGQRAEINTHHKLRDWSFGGPYFVRPSQVFLCDMVQGVASSRPSSPSPCRAVTPGISGMRAKLSEV